MRTPRIHPPRGVREDRARSASPPRPTRSVRGSSAWIRPHDHDVRLVRRELWPLPARLLALLLLVVRAIPTGGLHVDAALLERIVGRRRVGRPLLLADEQRDARLEGEATG